MKFEDFDFYVECSDWHIKFFNSKNEFIGVKRDEKCTIIKRLLKAYYNSYCFDIKVLSVGEKDKIHNWYKFPIKVIAEPYLKKEQ